MVGPAAKREAVAHLRGRAGDERAAGVSIVAADRKLIRYRSRRSPETELRARLCELANHLTATGHRAALHDGSARRPVAHIAPETLIATG